MSHTPVEYGALDVMPAQANTANMPIQGGLFRTSELRRKQCGELEAQPKQAGVLLFTTEQQGEHDYMPQQSR